MKVKDLIEKLKELPQEKTVFCQLIAGDDVWNMWFEFNDVPSSDWLIQLRIYHPELKKLKK